MRSLSEKKKKKKKNAVLATKMLKKLSLYVFSTKNVSVWKIF